MTWHVDMLEMVKLETASSDFQSPSRFVQAVKKIDGVQEAFRTAGRWDAVVWIRPDHREGESEADALARATGAALEVRGLEGVIDATYLVSRADEEHGAHGEGA